MSLIKWVLIILCSLFVLDFFGSKYFGLNIEYLFTKDSSKIIKQLENSSEQLSKQVRETTQNISDEFTGKEKEATIKFSEPKRMASEKLCNEAILVAMSDNSDKAQQAKNEACKPD